MNAHETELSAWVWLLNLPRPKIPARASRTWWRHQHDRQLLLAVVPGKLGANNGAPGVRISAWLPGIPKRVTGSGNDLYQACERLQADAWRAGLKLPFLSVSHLERTQP